MCDNFNEDIQVEIIFPEKYVEHNIKTMPKYASAIAHLCKAGAILGEDEIEFAVEGMTVLQVYTVEKAMQKFGIEMTHDHSPIETVFYADVSGLKKMLEGEEQHGDEI
jgi:hypothetical protein